MEGEAFRLKKTLKILILMGFKRAKRPQQPGKRAPTPFFYLFFILGRLGNIFKNI